MVSGTFNYLVSQQYIQQGGFNGNKKEQKSTEVEEGAA